MNESATYWRSNDGVRVRGQKGRADFDSLQRNSVVLTLGTNYTIVSERQRPGGTSPPKGGSITPAVGRPLPGCDAWELALFLFPGPGNGAEFMMLPFDELMNKSHRLNSVYPKTEAGKEYIVVSYTHHGTISINEFELWFDPQVNYLAWRSVIRQSDPRTEKFVYSATHQVTHFKEVAPGIFFPEGVVLKNVDGQIGRSTTFSEIRVNEAIPPDTFELRFPPDIQVFDTIEGKTYKTGRDGNPIGVISDLPMQVRSEPATPSMAATIEEPKSWTRWILPIGVALLLLGTVLVARRKWAAWRDT